MLIISSMAKSTRYMRDSMVGSSTMSRTMASHLTRPFWVPEDGLPLPWPSPPTTATTTSAGTRWEGYRFFTSVVTLVWSNSVFLDAICTTSRRASWSSPWSNAWRQMASTRPETLTVRCFAGVLDAGRRCEQPGPLHSRRQTTNLFAEPPQSRARLRVALLRLN